MLILSKPQYICVNCQIDGTNIYGCQAILEYNPEQLELKGAVLIENEFTEEWPIRRWKVSGRRTLGFVLLTTNLQINQPETGIINITFTVKELEVSTKVKYASRNRS